MMDGTIPEGLQVVPSGQALPPLGRVHVQLLEQPAPLSEAAHVVKRHIVSRYPGR